MINHKYSSNANIDLAHGSGGRKMHRLINELFLKYFNNPILARLEDSAEVVDSQVKKTLCPDYRFLRRPTDFLPWRRYR